MRNSRREETVLLEWHEDHTASLKSWNSGSMVVVLGKRPKGKHVIVLHAIAYCWDLYYRNDYMLGTFKAGAPLSVPE